MSGLAEPAPLTVTFPATHRAMYPVIGALLLDDGGVKAMPPLPLPAVAASPVGAPGAVTVGVGVGESVPFPAHPARLSRIAAAIVYRDVGAKHRRMGALQGDARV